VGMQRLSEVVRSGSEEDHAPEGDHAIGTTCLCGHRQSLAQAVFSQVTDEDAMYRCPKCGEVLVTMSSTEHPAREGGGWAVGPWRIWSASPLSWRPPGSAVASTIGPLERPETEG
jgi:hypothetical protein